MVEEPVDRQRPMRRSQALVTGLSIAHLRSKAWRREFHGIYVPAHMPPDDVATRIRAAACLLPPDGAVTGWAAAWWLGARVLDGRTPWGMALPVPLAVPVHRRLAPRHGVACIRAPLPPSDVVEVRGVPVTTPLRTALELARATGPYDAAVAGVDAMLHVHLVTTDQLRGYLSTRAGWKRLPRARMVLADTDAGAENPMETMLRLLWQSVTGRRPVANRYIYDRGGRFVGRADLLDEEIATVGQFDGDVHATRRARTMDARRRRSYEHAGLTVIQATSIDLLGDRGPLEAEIRRTERDRRGRDRARDRWTLTRPVRGG